MDKIWFRNPSKSEAIGRCSEDEKPNDYAEPTTFKVELLKKKRKKGGDHDDGGFNNQLYTRILCFVLMGRMSYYILK